MASTTASDPVLAELVAYVRREANPVRIVLFGSRARGFARPDSDYDLLVVVDDEQVERAVARRLYALKRGVRASSDFFVVTRSSDAATRRDTWWREALETSRILYER